MTTPGRPPVVITLFGAFSLTVNGVAVTGFRSNKARALLAYTLLTQPKPLLRAEISEMLWAGYTEPSAQANLRQTLANLRDCLAPFDLFQSTRSHLTLARDPALLWSDVHQFEALLDACQQHVHHTLADCSVCRPRLQAAVALAQAPLLENLPETDSTPFNIWLQSQRARLAARLAEAQAALQTSATGRGNLPPPLTSLVGRTHELADLTEKLHHPAYRCVTVVGPGGIGKTRLAVAAGAQLRTEFPDGVWLVELGGLAPTTPAEPPAQVHDRLAAAIGQSLRLVFYGATPLAEQIANQLAGKSALLILDSFEHLVAGAAWLPTLLAAAPHLRLLVTTRHRLPLQSQLTYLLEGLSVPPAAAAHERSVTHLLAQYAGVQLFVERAESSGLPLPLDQATLAAVGAICRFVEGSPWAIELAVAMLDQQTPAAILATIQQNYRLLTTPLLDIPMRQRSAEAVFRTAWALLTPAEAHTLARCAVFRGGFTLAAAQRIAGATLESLDLLVQKSLLRLTGAGRYTIHDLVRQFAEEQLAQAAADYQQSRTAHAAYFTELLATWQPDEATEQRFRTAVTQEWDNVQAAWHWAVASGQVALLQQGVAGLAEFYEMSGLFLEFDRIFGWTLAQVRLWQSADQELTDAPAAPITVARQTLLAHLLWRHSFVLVAGMGQVEEGQRLAEELVAWGQQLADEMLVAWGYRTLSVVALLQGDFHRQQTLLLQALAYAQRHNDQYAQVIYLELLGISSKELGDYAAAQHYFEAALTLAQRARFSRRVLMISQNLGAFHWEANNFTAATRYLQQTLQYAQQAEMKEHIAFSHFALGALAYTLGDYTDARRHWEAAFQAYHALSDHVTAAQLMTALAALYLEMGENAVAGDYCASALASPAAQTFNVQREALLIQGHLQRAAGEWAAARTTYEAAYALSQQTNLVATWLPVQLYLAILALEQGATVAALAAVEPVLTNFAEMNLSAAQRPQELLWLAYQILVANQDPRATNILHQAWALVQDQLAKIEDPRLRETFLTNVPVNRELARLVNANRTRIAAAHAVASAA